MEIGLDFDGVISDCGALKSEFARQMFDKNIEPAFFKREILVSKGLMTSKQYTELQRVIYDTREAGLTMKPVNGAKATMEKLIREGHRLKIITSRSPIGETIAREWMALLGFPQIEIVALGHGVSKKDAARGLDAYVDDDTDKLAPLADTVPYLFLFSWPYNIAEKESAGVHRVSSWHEFHAALCEIVDKKRTDL